MSTSWTFGTDPEFPLVKDGKFFSAIDIVKATKYKRHKIGKNEFYYDNVLAECTITPSKNKEEALSNMKTALTSFAKLVNPFKLHVQASMDYPQDQLQHKDAIAIGCDREFCAYGGANGDFQVEPPEEVMQSRPLRSGGGHIHLGCKYVSEKDGNDRKVACLSVIRMCDLFIGVPSIFLDKDKTSLERKKLYGKAGRFRPPEHGAEYRSLSNFWTASPQSVSLIYDLADFVVDFCTNERHNKLWFFDQARYDDENAWGEEGFQEMSCHKCIGYDVEEMRTGIDTMNKKIGAKYMDFIRPYMPEKLFSDIQTEIDRKPVDLYKAWNL